MSTRRCVITNMRYATRQPMFLRRVSLNVMSEYDVRTEPELWCTPSAVTGPLSRSKLTKTMPLSRRRTWRNYSTLITQQQLTENAAWLDRRQDRWPHRAKSRKSSRRAKNKPGQAQGQAGEQAPGSKPVNFAELQHFGMVQAHELSPSSITSPWSKPMTFHQAPSPRHGPSP